MSKEEGAIRNKLKMEVDDWCLLAVVQLSL